MSWKDKIRDEDCTLCPLHESADHVCLMGQGSRKASIMIVGEAPGEREDDEHVAFVGPSGQLLRRELKAVGIEPSECYITNVAKCRPPSNRTPTRKEAKLCSATYLSQELEAVNPDFVLGVGNAPLQALVGRSGITKYRGQTFGDSPVFMPTFHPAYVLRSPQHGPTFRSDLERFARMVRGEGSAIPPTRTKLVRTVPGLSALIEELGTAKVISFDIETTGLDEWVPGARIVSIGFSTEVGRSTVVPIHHAESPWRDPDKVLGALKRVMERTDAKYVAHNGKFDCRWLAAAGIFVPLTFDTMLAAHMLDENRYKSLEFLSQFYLGVEAYKDMVDKSDMFNAPIKTLARYNGRDTDYTLRLYYILKEEMKSEPRIARVFIKLLMPANNVLTKVELGGIYIDPTRLKAQMHAVGTAKETAWRNFRKHLPPNMKELNPNSPQQLARFFFGHLKLPIVLETKTGAPSTNESVMLQLARKHPAPALLLEYRKHKGNLEKLVSWNARRDHKSRIHTTYKPHGTVTGRLSSVEPNLQQVPREGPMRACFGAPPGWLFIEGDYSQIELRVAAMLARDRTLLRIFATGGDPHLTTACEITGLTPQQVLDSDATGKTEHRKKAKAVNFGFLYRMGAQKFVDYARDNYGVEVSLGEAQRVRRRYYELYDRLLPWHDRQVRLAQRYQRVHSPIGRIRHLPDVLSSDAGRSAEAERQAINSPVQSLASDFMLMSMVRLDRRLPGTRCRIVGTVHDALLFESREDYVDEAATIIRETMEDLTPMKKAFGLEVTVPIKVDLKVGRYWGER